MGRKNASVPVFLAHQDYRFNQNTAGFILKNLLIEMTFLKTLSFSASC